MFKIQTLNSIATMGLNLFPSDLYEVSSKIKHPDAILVRSMNLHDMTFMSSVKVIGRAGVGVNNIPVKELTKLGIPVLNTVGANANAVRELVIAGMLLASRNICQAWDYVRQLNADESEFNNLIEQNKSQFVGSELLGKTLGVIGLGSIGVKVANSAMNLGMQVIGYDPTITVSRAWELSSGVKQARSLETLLSEVDFITLHVPLTETTKNMMNATRLKSLKHSITILNFARDDIIDNNALLTALNENKVSAYVTDFPSLQLKNHPRVISLPHLGASTKEAENNCAVMVVKQIRDFLEHGNIINSVNFPTIEMPRHEKSMRLSIVNANVPNIVAQISSKLGNAGLNILGLSNGSQDEIAYTLIDVNSDVSDTLLKEIAGIKGIMRVRRITP